MTRGSSAGRLRAVRDLQGRLIFVRHAQGSLFSSNYDQLSELGQMQARRLGAHWGGLGERFDAVFTGPAQRHRDTESLAREASAEVGIEWPAVQIVEDLDEHDAAGLMRGVIPQVSQKREDLRPLIERALAKIEDERERQRVWEALFVEVLAMWREGEVGVEGIETWAEFRTRVRRGLDQVLSQSTGQRVVVYSSIGPAAITLERALGTSAHVAYATAWRLLNCSVCQFVHHDDALGLESLNRVPHLDPEHWTTR